MHFHIYTNASGTALRGVLGQKENQYYYAIYFIRTKLTPAELNYTITEKELLVVVHAINKFRHYIMGYAVFVHTDHSAIWFFMNKYITSGKVTRCLVLMQEFNITIIYKPRKQKLVAYFLSRLTHDGENIPLDDDFSDEHLFVVAIKMPWFADIANYLAKGKIQVYLPKHEKR